MSILTWTCNPPREYFPYVIFRKYTSSEQSTFGLLRLIGKLRPLRVRVPDYVDKRVTAVGGRPHL